MPDDPDVSGAAGPAGMTRRELVALLGGALSASLDAGPAGAARPPRVVHASDDHHFDTIAAVAKLIQSRSLSPVALVERTIARIKAIDGHLHSYVLVLEDQAMASARTAESEIAAGRSRGPLHGIPVGVKDLIFTRGIPTRGGTEALRDFIPDYDATVVRRLASAGAVLIGKHTLCEGAMGPYHPKLAVPVNPWNAERWSGVSSSGSGVAVAAGLCFASIGTDTGGSIRYPAAANGCVGLKPTYGRISRYGVLALAESLDHVGPMCRTVEDAAILFDILAGHDEHDPTTRIEPVQPVRPQLEAGVSGLRIGFDRGYSSDGVEPGLLTAMDAVLEKLADLGATLVDVQMPDVSMVGDAWWDLSTVEAAAFHAPTYPSRRGDYGPGFLDVLDYGSSLSGVQYSRANRIRLEIAGRVNALLAGVDCMVCPTMSNAAGPKLENPFIPETAESWERNVANDIHTKPFDFAGVPTLSVPCGFSSDGLPFSVQFVGRPLSEAVLCRVGHAYERATDWHLAHPDL
jgi:amidase